MFKDFNDRAYLVGGAVRDLLLGIAPKDLDYVVEATVQEFTNAFPEAQCVGASFPVFMIEGNEVALTRVEMSAGTGYRDFVCEVGVSIMEDLGRRDFTINSIAQRYDVTQQIIDPHGGVEDLRAGILRCINPCAFTEDPLRMVRACRFLARFPHFRLDPLTRQLIEDSAHLIHTVLPERLEKELQKVYEQSPNPSIFFKEMYTLGLLKHHFPTLHKMVSVTAGPNEYHGGNTAFQHTMESVDRCKANGFSFSVFVAVLYHDTGKAETPTDILPHHYGHEYRSADIVEREFTNMRFDYFTHRLSLCVAKNHMRTHLLIKMRPAKVVKFIRSIRKEMREEFFNSCHCDHEVSAEAREIVARAEQAIKSTVIVLPQGMKGREVIDTYVTGKITETYRRHM